MLLLAASCGGGCLNYRAMCSLKMSTKAKTPRMGVGPWRLGCCWQGRNRPLGGLHDRRYGWKLFVLQCLAFYFCPAVSQGHYAIEDWFVFLVINRIGAEISQAFELDRGACCRAVEV